MAHALQDPEGWRAEQETKLLQTATRRTEMGEAGWEVGGAKLKRMLKLIDKQLLTLLATAGAPQSQSAAQTAADMHGRRADGKRKSGRPVPSGWEQVDGPVQAETFKDAAAQLLPDPTPYGKWKQDTDAPGNAVWRRYISVADNSSDFERARVSCTDEGYVYEKGMVEPMLVAHGLVGSP